MRDAQSEDEFEHAQEMQQFAQFLVDRAVVRENAGLDGAVASEILKFARWLDDALDQSPERIRNLPERVTENRDIVEYAADRYIRDRGQKSRPWE